MQKEFFEIGVLVAARETVHLSRGSSGRNSRAFPSSFCEAGEGYPHFLKSSKEGSRRSWGTYMRGFCLLAPCWTPAEPSLATRQSTEEGPRQHWPCPCSAGTCVKQRPGSAPVLEILKMQVGLEHPWHHLDSSNDRGRRPKDHTAGSAAWNNFLPPWSLIPHRPEKQEAGSKGGSVKERPFPLEGSRPQNSLGEKNFASNVRLVFSWTLKGSKVSGIYPDRTRLWSQKQLRSCEISLGVQMKRTTIKRIYGEQ